MHRGGWLVLLVSSITAMVLAGVGIGWAGQSKDMGTIEVPAKLEAAQQPEERAPQPVTDTANDKLPQAGVALTAPDVARRSAEVSTLGDSSSPPVRLRAPSVELNAPVDATGVRRDGLMQIPDDGRRAGWYRFGAAPGQGTGSVVLAGHVDTDQGLGAMAALRRVERGARIEVELGDGSVETYQVTGRRTISKNVLPTDRIFDRGGPERLTLLTCGGPWRSSEQSYRDNVVVVATPTDQS
jgi:sortase (surface protein transpeptidase)